MTISPGSRIGPYEILSALGSGGMGEVYRATDTKLKRDVAVKVLPPLLAVDPDRLARLHREAEVLASLNHPHIAAIYGLEDAGSVTALVMELVEGPTLEERIAHGVIPLDDVLAIAKQIAEAMEAAHERGIIHRDLKPANIKIGADATVKVLDFGLAKLSGETLLRSVPSSPTQAPTLSPIVTGIGTILGTAAYLSPEQARGGTADKRSDIFSFGCVFYEMLTGKRAFTGASVSDTLANVLVMEPDWGSLPAELPLSVARLLRASVEKDRRRRVSDFSTVLFVLMHDLGPGRGNAGAPVAASAPASRRARIVATAVALIALAAGAAVWTTPRQPPLRVARVTVTSPTDAPLTVSGADRDLAISPDGGRIAYIGSNGTEISVRSLDQLESLRISGIGNPRGVFFAPDGLSVGFFDASSTLRTMPIRGGASTVIHRADGLPSGATWGADGSIIFATGNVSTGLQRIPATGGGPIVLTRPNSELGEGDHRWPEFLPGGRFVLFTIVPAAGGIANARVAVLDLETSMQTVLIRGGSHARYVSSGHLVYAVASGSLWATAFDLKRLAVAGTPTQVLSPLVVSAAGAADFDVGLDGTLVYVAGAGSAVRRALVWVDRQGGEEPISAPPRAYLSPKISPDGTRVAIDVRDQEGDIWMWDFKRQALSRATFSTAGDRYPVWSPDGRRLLFSSDSSGTSSLFVQPSDGTREPERLTSATTPQAPTAFSPDGSSVVFHQLGPNTDLMMLTLKQRTVQPLLKTRFAEQNGVISSDSRWLAYQSDESGRFEIHVRPFRDPSSGHWQLSTEGGVRPVWARNGRELFFLTLQGVLMSVSVGEGATFSPGPPKRAVDGKYYFGNIGSPRTYDVAPDGQRFLMIKPVEDTTPPASVIMVQNWGEELKRLMPAN